MISDRKIRIGFLSCVSGRGLSSGSPPFLYLSFVPVRIVAILSPIAPLKSHYTFFHSFLFILSARVQIVKFLRRNNPALPENYLLKIPGREYQFWEPVIIVKFNNTISPQ